MSGGNVGNLLLLEHGCYFAVGIMLWRLKELGSSKVYAACLILFTGTCIVATAATSRALSVNRGEWSAPYYWAVLVWLLTVLLMFCAVRWNSALARYLHPYAPAIRFAGLVTYPLYLVHWELGRAVLLAIGGRQPLLALAVALATVGVVACSVAALEPPIRSRLRQRLELSSRRAAADLP